MTLQYLRRVSLTVEGAGKAINLHSSGQDDQNQLRVRFRVEQNNRSTPNVCNIYINNLKDETANGIRTEYKRITLSAGYRDSERMIFKGEILQVRVGRENVVDKYLHILATSGERARNAAVVNKALAAGHTYRDRVDAAVAAMAPYGITVGHIAELPTKKFARGFAFFGPAKDLLRQVCEGAGASWSIQNDRFQLEKNDRAIPGGTIVLNSKTGLVGLPVQTIQGIEGQCLLNPLLVPGGLVKIDERSVQQAALSPAYGQAAQNEIFPSIAADGVYKALVVNHEGDTRGQQFYTDFIGIKNGDPISKALAQAGIEDPGVASR